jgi:hypothetical protein
LHRALRNERLEGVALGLRPAAVRLRQDDVDVLTRRADGYPSESARRDVVADLVTLTVSTMFIIVNDPDEALGFYRDALGFAASV